MRLLILLFLILQFTSCIPISIAPSIETDKVMPGKKFKRHLPKQYAFIFEDPKNADEFYHYINTKYQLDHNNVEYNVPFIINNEQFFFSFHEVERTTKTINLIPIALDLALAANDVGPIAEDLEFSRKGNWYIAITVSNNGFEDCLDPTFEKQKEVLQFLKNMRVEYLTTHNYMEAFLKN